MDKLSPIDRLATAAIGYAVAATTGDPDSDAGRRATAAAAAAFRAALAEAHALVDGLRAEAGRLE